MPDRTLRITCMGNDKTVLFAADELQRCLTSMTGCNISLDVKTSADLIDGNIILGTHSALPFLDMPDVDNPAFDDAILIDIKDGVGYIAGINPRSVLLAVYRYLTVIGCRWPRPGVDGEFIPQIDVLPDVSLIEVPSYRHRGVCIEGAVSYEHVRDMIDWIPKLGFNAYFIQFREGFTFFDRWYSHQGNPFMDVRKITVDEARQFTADAIDEIHKRGMIFHAVGHGWTCEPFGIPGLGWDDQEYDVPTDSYQYMAMVEGNRDLWYGVPLNTNLCYSNPAVRELVTDEIVQYAEDHPSTDILHFWLADGSNNNCECDECSVLRPSDFYVQMLNELDTKLTAKGIATKVVFLIYVDLLWPPISDRIENPDRFILMFAPITRTYSESFKPGDDLPELPPYERNKLAFPKDVDGSVAFLKAWQSMFSGDSFDFDYHLMWDHVNDPGHMKISEIIHQDMKALKKLGLNGYVSCQLQRIFFPMGLAMDMMGKTLWNTDIDFEVESAEYFDGAFGADGSLCRDYLSKMSTLFDPVYMRGEKPAVDESAPGRFKDAIKLIDEFKGVIERNQSLSDPCHQLSWKYLAYHADITRKLAEALEVRATGDVTKASEIWVEEMDAIRKLEPVLHPVLDVQSYNGLTNGKFHIG